MRNLSSPDIRCGVNATNTGPETGVALVEAGSKVGFRVDFRVKSVSCSFVRERFLIWEVSRSMLMMGTDRHMGACFPRWPAGFISIPEP